MVGEKEYLPYDHFRASAERKKSTIDPHDLRKRASCWDGSLVHVNLFLTVHTSGRPRGEGGERKIMNRQALQHLYQRKGKRLY